MAKVVQISGQAATAYTASGTFYLPAFQALVPGTGASTEAWFQRTYRTSGVLSNLFVNVTANATAASSTLISRQNGGNGAMSITINAASTGEFTDATNSDSVTAGDEMGLQLSVGSGGTITLSGVVTTFEANSNTVIIWGQTPNAGTNITGAGTTYQTLAGSSSGGTEADVQTQVHSAGTWRNLYVYISANGRSSTTTFRGRINGANGNQSIAVTASSTGVFEDTSNSDSISAGDELNYNAVAGSGSGTLTWYSLSSEYETTDNTYTSVSGRLDVEISSSLGTRYIFLGGRAEVATTESLVAMDMTTDGIISKLWGWIRFNNSNNTHVFTVRNNAGDTAVTFSVAASTSGEFIDSSNSASFVTTDELAIKMVDNSTSGSCRMCSLSSLVTVSGATPSDSQKPIKLLMMLGVGT